MKSWWVAVAFGGLLAGGAALGEELAGLPGWDNRLAGTGGEPLPYEVVEAFPGLKLAAPTDLDAVPVSGSKSYFALEVLGVVKVFSEAAPAVSSEDLYTDEVSRFFSLAFDPAFPERPFVYVSSNRKNDENARNHVFRLTVSIEGERFQIDPDSRLDLISWASDGHNGCDLKFGPSDAMLYISTGDGQAPGDPKNTGQHTDDLLSSMLRIDVTDATPDEPYRVPVDNPYVEQTDVVRPEVWAYGLRNPWKMNFHPENEALFVGDNGDENWDMVRHVTAGSNHGWSAFEGSHLFRATTQLAPPQTALSLPVWEHPHTDVRSVIGGLFYRGKELSQLSGYYVYGCYFTHRVWALKWDGAVTDEPRRIADTGLQVVGFAESHDREILVVTFDGGVQKLIAKPANAEPPKSLPDRLSKTGLLDGESIFPYQIQQPLWEDGRVAARFLALPEGADQIDAVQGENQRKSWKMPNGAALARTISEDERKVETQVMHLDGGEWKFLTYRWLADQSDAELVPAEGMTDESGYRFMGRSECTSCHTQRSFFTLGLSTEQMRVGDQIERLVDSGVFRKNRQPAEGNRRVEGFEADLDSQARSYLHTNCAHCHRETGLGGRAQFQLLHWLPLEELGVLNATPLVGMPGLADSKIIKPGKPEESEIYRRMVSELPGMRMPLLGSHHIDSEGAELIRRWIAEMPAEGSLVNETDVVGGEN